ncbi:hypothetical protein V501_00083 [Pseudogymnoascus sp. VKM F-4519 (FW-2642)]|nr:hypothetical protein V501_00083 [Pseudogymnoascus sp. VKM F-4519 (FW-2642)]
MEEFAKCSLPSISSLLGIADNSPSQQQQQSRPMSEHTEKDPVRYTSSSAATTRRQSLPLTPPTHPDLVLKTRHPPSSSISSTSQYGCVLNPAPFYFTARTTTNLDLNAERECVVSAESRRVSMPFAQPQYGLPSLSVMVPALQNMNNHYPTVVGKPHISDGVNHQQPLLNVGVPLLDALGLFTNYITVHFAIYKSLATSPLHSSVVLLLPIFSGSLHMSEMRQRVFPTFEFENPQPQPYGGEAIPLPSQRVWEKVQCGE